MINAISCAFRGRYKEDGSTEQRLEINNDIANCLTGVQKDSMVIEIKEVEDMHQRTIEITCDNNYVIKENPFFVTLYVPDDVDDEEYIDEWVANHFDFNYYTWEFNED